MGLGTGDLGTRRADAVTSCRCPLDGSFLASACATYNLRVAEEGPLSRTPHPDLLPNGNSCPLFTMVCHARLPVADFLSFIPPPLPLQVPPRCPHQLTTRRPQGSILTSLHVDDVEKPQRIFVTFFVSFSLILHGNNCPVISNSLTRRTVTTVQFCTTKEKFRAPFLLVTTHHLHYAVHLIVRQHRHTCAHPSCFTTLLCVVDGTYCILSDRVSEICTHTPNKPRTD